MASKLISTPHLEVSEKLADAAHEAWRIRMLAEGWKLGTVFDRQALVHDALVPFSKLDDEDRWTAIQIVEGMRLEERLAQAIEYSRGADRILMASEMRVGLVVQSAFDPEQGTVVSWETNPRTGRLEIVRVEWSDGEVTEHAPAERELKRVEA